MVKGYLYGTLAAAVTLHVAISLFVPGDGGTMVAISSGAILFTLFIVSGFIGSVAFPIAAVVSWPLRGLVSDKPLLALLLAGGTGLGIGAFMTALDFRVGPGDYWSGSLVGLMYGLAWFYVVRTSGQPNIDD